MVRRFLLPLALGAGAVWAQPSLDAARAAARADRNAESAQLFRQALREAPQRRRELLLEYADQLLYAGQAADSVPLFREVLEAPTSEAERRQALKGLGLALLWSDRASEARPVWEQVVREQPGDADASRNLARALSWSGRQREAVAHLERHLLAHPGDGEARVQLAQARVWMGRGDVALADLRDVQRPDAETLRRQLARDTAPRTVLDTERSTQSDDLAIRRHRFQHGVSLANGRAALGMRLEQYDYERGDGGDGARVQRPMVLGRWRASDDWEWNLELGQERIRADGGATHRFTAYNTWLTWWPSDVLRLDLSSGRGDFDNLQSLRLGLTHTEQGISADYTPTERHRWSARLQHSRYSDGNRRDFGQLEGEYRWRTHPDLWAGLRYSRFEFDRQLNNGYFNPLRFQSLVGTVRLSWRPTGPEDRWELDVRGAWGREHAVPDGSKPTHDLSLRAGYRFDPKTRLELRAQRFSSRTSSSAGFARTIVGAQVERSW